MLLSYSNYIQHEISIAADNGIGQVVEETNGEVTASEKVAAMKSTVEKKSQSFE